MADHVEGFVPGHYLSRSWALLTRDSGWVKPVLVLSLVALVPIIGPIAVIGYALEWARLTAWGFDAAPKQKRVDVGQVLVSGWRGVVVGFVWEFVLWAVYALLSWAFGNIPGESQGFWPGGFIDLIYGAACVVTSAIVMVAQIRGILYQRIGAGLRADRVFQMAKRDFGGLMHMVGMELLGWLVTLCLGIIFGTIGLAIVTPYLVGLDYSSSALLPGSRALGTFIAGILGSLSVPFVLLLFLASMVVQITTLLCITGVALWMRQFDVPRWGKSSDPLPQASEGNHEHQGTSEVAGAAEEVGGPETTSDVSGDGVPTDAPATRTTTTIIREPGKRPVVVTKTEVIGDRGVIHQGGPTEESPDVTSSGEADESH